MIAIRLTLLLTLQVSLWLHALDSTVFADHTIAPSPACLCVHPNGAVFVGVDLNGSLGQGPGKGRIIRLVDDNHDGVADSHTVYAEIDNPRGLIAVGDQVFVLHTEVSAKSQKISAMHLSVLTDANQDGKADGSPKILLRDVSPPKPNADRGADHTTNGIRMGIDGWIYIAVGDFGMVNTTGTDGTKLTMLGGGVVRVRPDGTELEVYTHGLRNIYDVAIDPFMNIYTRGNTNDGGGWNVRFIHHIQSGEYGYPMLFKRFTGEILPALVDVGGGSGTGSLYLSEPTWSAPYNNQPLMADWRLSKIIVHNLTPDGASFTQKEAEKLESHQVTDLDVDGSGRLYISEWQGAGYKGNDGKGGVKRLVPSHWKYKEFPDLKKADSTELIELLESDSATARLHAQQALLKIPSASQSVLGLAQNKSASLASRVAAIYTYAQLTGTKGINDLVALCSDSAIQEHALRALADRKPWTATVPLKPFYDGLTASDPRIQAAAIIGLGRLGKPEAAAKLLPFAADYNPFAAGAVKTRGLNLGPLQAGESVDFTASFTGYKGKAYIVAKPLDGSKPTDRIVVTNMSMAQTGGKTFGSPVASFQAGKGKKAKQNAPEVLGDDGAKFKPGIVTRFKPQGDSMTGSVTIEGAGSYRLVVTTSQNGLPDPAEGPHATPNADVILPHLAVAALRNLDASDTCLKALTSDHATGALWALQGMHTQSVVDTLIKQFNSSSDINLKKNIITVLCRLGTTESEFKGLKWWGTMPDTRGPYYYPTDWAGSATVRDFVASITDAELKAHAEHQATFMRLNEDSAGGDAGQPTIGSMSIEDVVVALGKTKGKADNGRKLLSGQHPVKQLACIGCHVIEGPAQNGYPSLVGLKASRDELIESILRPNAAISPNWYQVTKKDGSPLIGTLLKKNANSLSLAMVGGTTVDIALAEVKSHSVQESTLMGPGLANALTVEEFADVIAFIESMGK